jgi:hypothetical protein
MRNVLISNHVLAGALIGRAVAKRPGLAFAAGVVSHALMDTCPHWGLPEEEYDRFIRVARCDGCAGLAAMAAGAALSPRTSRLAVLAGMLGASVVDADKPAEYFFGINPFPEPVRRFHGWIQREADHRLPHEILVALALAVLLLWSARGSGRSRGCRRSR